MTEQEAYELGLARSAEAVSRMIMKKRSSYLEKVLAGVKVTVAEIAADKALNDLDSDIAAYMETI